MEEEEGGRGGGVGLGEVNGRRGGGRNYFFSNKRRRIAYKHLFGCPMVKALVIIFLWETLSC